MIRVSILMLALMLTLRVRTAVGCSRPSAENFATESAATQQCLANGFFKFHRTANPHLLNCVFQGARLAGVQGGAYERDAIMRSIIVRCEGAMPDGFTGRINLILIMLTGTKHDIGLVRR